MSESRSRNRQKRAAKATRPARQPVATTSTIPPVAAVEPVPAHSEDDRGGIAIALAMGGLAFAGFLTVLLVIAASGA
jgi:hypothetical protein